MDAERGALSASELADLAGVTEAEVDRLVGLGILVARDGPSPFLPADAQKVRLATACEQAGLPMDGIAAAIRAGRLSFGFLEAAPFRRWAVRSTRSFCRWGMPRCWPSTTGNRSCCGPRAWSSGSRASWRRPGCWGGRRGG